ncbi:MAG: hypothetical protein ACREM1_22005, partial [Longimicrobiales bacterium]
NTPRPVPDNAAGAIGHKSAVQSVLCVVRARDWIGRPAPDGARPGIEEWVNAGLPIETGDGVVVTR